MQFATSSSPHLSGPQSITRVMGMVMLALIPGTLAMARKQDLDSAGSQFYICLTAQPHLDGQYCVFGQVVEGMDIVQSIRAGDVMRSVTRVGAKR